MSVPLVSNPSPSSGRAGWRPDEPSRVAAADLRRATPCPSRAPTVWREPTVHLNRGRRTVVDAVVTASRPCPSMNLRATDLPVGLAVVEMPSHRGRGLVLTGCAAPQGTSCSRRPPSALGRRHPRRSRSRSPWVLSSSPPLAIRPAAACCLFDQALDCCVASTIAHRSAHRRPGIRAAPTAPKDLRQLPACASLVGLSHRGWKSVSRGISTRGKPSSPPPEGDRCAARAPC